MKKADEIKDVREHLETGLVALDELLGGGLEIGCITEFFGVQSVGKSTLALQILAEAQKKGRPVLYSDTEFAFTPNFALKLGVELSKLDVTQERLGEDTFDAIMEWVEDNKGGVVVLDSMGGVLSREEAEKTSEGRTIGLQARLMGSFCRKIIGLLHEKKVALIVVNHQVTNLTTGAIGSSGGSKLAFHKRYSIRLKDAFGKAPKRSSDGSKTIKFIEAELKKEKGEDTKEGKKVELIYDSEKGFINDAPVAKRGRPKLSV